MNKLFYALGAALMMGIASAAWSADTKGVEQELKQSDGSEEQAEEVYHSVYLASAQECKTLQASEKRACLKAARAKAAKAARTAPR